MLIDAANRSPTATEPPVREASVARLRRVTRDEVGQFRFRLALMKVAIAALPPYTSFRVRTRLMRAAGFDIGKRSAFLGAPNLGGDGDLASRLIIGTDCAINIGCVLDLNGNITIGNHVNVGHQVMILTTTHHLGTAACRAGRHKILPVTIEDGVWLCARSTILAGVTVGAGSIVSAGAVVSKDVPPNSVVSGSPARVVVPKLR